MKIAQLVFIILLFGLSGCAFNNGFPQEVKGELKPINSQKVMRDVES